MSKRKKPVPWPWPIYSPEEYAAARERAERELQVPPPGPRGSINAKIRQHLGTKIATRARQLLYLARADRYTQLQAAFDAGKGRGDDARGDPPGEGAPVRMRQAVPAPELPAQ